MIFIQYDLSYFYSALYIKMKIYPERFTYITKRLRNNSKYVTENIYVYIYISIRNVIFYNTKYLLLIFIMCM